MSHVTVTCWPGGQTQADTLKPLRIGHVRAVTDVCAHCPSEAARSSARSSLLCVVQSPPHPGARPMWFLTCFCRDDAHTRNNAQRGVRMTE